MMIKQYENSKIIASLVKAFAEVKQATRSEINPYFKSKYADLSEIDNACRDALVNNKLSIMQIPKYRGENVLEIQTTILHEDGEVIKCEPTGIIIEKLNSHGIGSAISYLRRYTLASLMGVITKDDDGNDSVNSPVKRGLKTDDATSTIVKIKNAKSFKDLENVWLDIPASIKKINKVIEEKNNTKKLLQQEGS